MMLSSEIRRLGLRLNKRLRDQEQRKSEKKLKSELKDDDFDFQELNKKRSGKTQAKHKQINFI